MDIASWFSSRRSPADLNDEDELTRENRPLLNSNSPPAVSLTASDVASPLLFSLQQQYNQWTSDSFDLPNSTNRAAATFPGQSSSETTPLTSHPQLYGSFTDPHNDPDSNPDPNLPSTFSPLISPAHPLTSELIDPSLLSSTLLSRLRSNIKSSHFIPFPFIYDNVLDYYHLFRNALNLDSIFYNDAKPIPIPAYVHHISSDNCANPHTPHNLFSIPTTSVILLTIAVIFFTMITLLVITPLLQIYHLTTTLQNLNLLTWFADFHVFRFHVSAYLLLFITTIFIGVLAALLLQNSFSRKSLLTLTSTTALTLLAAMLGYFALISANLPSNPFETHEADLPTSSTHFLSFLFRSQDAKAHESHYFASPHTSFLQLTLQFFSYFSLLSPTDPTHQSVNLDTAKSLTTTHNTHLSHFSFHYNTFTFFLHHPLSILWVLAMGLSLGVFIYTIHVYLMETATNTQLKQYLPLHTLLLFFSTAYFAQKYIQSMILTLTHADSALLSTLQSPLVPILASFAVIIVFCYLFIQIILHVFLLESPFWIALAHYTPRTLTPPHSTTAIISPLSDIEPSPHQHQAHHNHHPCNHNHSQHPSHYNNNNNNTNSNNHSSTRPTSSHSTSIPSPLLSSASHISHNSHNSHRSNLSSGLCSNGICSTDTNSRTTNPPSDAIVFPDINPIAFTGQYIDYVNEKIAADLQEFQSNVISQQNAALSKQSRKIFTRWTATQFRSVQNKILKQFVQFNVENGKKQQQHCGKSGKFDRTQANITDTHGNAKVATSAHIHSTGLDTGDVGDIKVDLPNVNYSWDPMTSQLLISNGSAVNGRNGTQNGTNGSDFSQSFEDYEFIDVERNGMNGTSLHGSNELSHGVHSINSSNMNEEQPTTQPDFPNLIPLPNLSLINPGEILRHCESYNRNQNQNQNQNQDQLISTFLTQFHSFSPFSPPFHSTMQKRHYFKDLLSQALTHFNRPVSNQEKMVMLTLIHNYNCYQVGFESATMTLLAYNFTKIRNLFSYGYIQHPLHWFSPFTALFAPQQSQFGQNNYTTPPQREMNDFNNNNHLNYVNFNDTTLPQLQQQHSDYLNFTSNSTAAFYEKNYPSSHQQHQYHHNQQQQQQQRQRQAFHRGTNNTGSHTPSHAAKLHPQTHTLPKPEFNVFGQDSLCVPYCDDNDDEQDEYNQYDHDDALQQSYQQQSYQQSFPRHRPHNFATPHHVRVSPMTTPITTSNNQSLHHPLTAATAAATATTTTTTAQTTSTPTMLPSTQINFTTQQQLNLHSLSGITGRPTRGSFSQVPPSPSFQTRTNLNDFMSSLLNNDLNTNNNPTTATRNADSPLQTHHALPLTHSQTPMNATSTASPSPNVHRLPTIASPSALTVDTNRATNQLPIQSDLANPFASLYSDPMDPHNAQTQSNGEYHDFAENSPERLARLKEDFKNTLLDLSSLHPTPLGTNTTHTSHHSRQQRDSSRNQQNSPNSRQTAQSEPIIYLDFFNNTFSFCYPLVLVFTYLKHLFPIFILLLGFLTSFFLTLFIPFQSIVYSSTPLHPKHFHETESLLRSLITASPEHHDVANYNIAWGTSLLMVPLHLSTSTSRLYAFIAFVSLLISSLIASLLYRCNTTTPADHINHRTHFIRSQQIQTQLVLASPLSVTSPNSPLSARASTYAPNFTFDATAPISPQKSAQLFRTSSSNLSSSIITPAKSTVHAWEFLEDEGGDVVGIDEGYQYQQYQNNTNVNSIPMHHQHHHIHDTNAEDDVKRVFDFDQSGAGITTNTTDTTLAEPQIAIVNGRKIQRTKPDNFVNLFELYGSNSSTTTITNSSTMLFELRYATQNNFTGTIVDGYTSPHIAHFTKPAAIALGKVNEYLIQNHGYQLKIFDSYRPYDSVQYFVKWSQNRLPHQQSGPDGDETTLDGEKYAREVYYPAFSDKTQLFQQGFIAEFSGHSRGSTVDLTIVDMKTRDELEMGTVFDFFGPESHHSFPNLPKHILDNRTLLKKVMAMHGFNHYAEEWWHYTLKNEPYPDTFFNFPISSASPISTTQLVSTGLSDETGSKFASLTLDTQQNMPQAIIIPADVPTSPIETPNMPQPTQQTSQKPTLQPPRQHLQQSFISSLSSLSHLPDDPNVGESYSNENANNESTLGQNPLNSLPLNPHHAYHVQQHVEEQLRHQLAPTSPSYHMRHLYLTILSIVMIFVACITMYFIAFHQFDLVVKTTRNINTNASNSTLSDQNIELSTHFHLPPHPLDVLLPESTPYDTSAAHYQRSFDKTATGQSDQDQQDQLPQHASSDSQYRLSHSTSLPLLSIQDALVQPVFQQVQEDVAQMESEDDDGKTEIDLNGEETKGQGHRDEQRQDSHLDTQDSEETSTSSSTPPPTPYTLVDTISTAIDNIQQMQNDRAVAVAAEEDDLQQQQSHGASLSPAFSNPPSELSKSNSSKHNKHNKHNQSPQTQTQNQNPDAFHQSRSLHHSTLDVIHFVDNSTSTRIHDNFAADVYHHPNHLLHYFSPHLLPALMITAFLGVNTMGISMLLRDKRYQLPSYIMMIAFPAMVCLAGTILTLLFVFTLPDHLHSLRVCCIAFIYLLCGATMIGHRKVIDLPQ